MKKLMTTIALVTLIAAPVFVSPADAVMAGLFAAVPAACIATAVRLGMSRSSSARQPSPSAPAGEAAEA